MLDVVRGPHRVQDVALDVELAGDVRLAEAEGRRVAQDAAEHGGRAEDDVEAAVAGTDAHDRSVPETEAERDTDGGEHAPENPLRHGHGSDLSGIALNVKVPSRARGGRF